MKVINFNCSEFEVYLQSIVDELIIDFQSILVLGVKEGGVPIATMVYQKLTTFKHVKVDYSEILCQRPTTKVKKKNPQREKLVKSIFRYTPEIVLNQIRVAEHHLLSSKKRNTRRTIHAEYERETNHYDLILIVDDAVDTGHSMAEIINYVKRQHHQSIIKTLSAVVTKKNPVIMPDYSLYRDVLIRFPWSLDAK